MTNNLIAARCPVCNHSIASVFFSGGEHPLATLAWPQTKKEAQNLTHYKHNFVQCPECTHVWNHSFVYDDIPYKSNPNRMFNKSDTWQGHLAVSRDVLLKHLTDESTIIEIGCGEGHFIRGLGEMMPRGRHIGFDPNGNTAIGSNIEFFPRIFNPLIDMEIFKPDAIIIRHVLEHLSEPSSLLEQLAWGGTSIGKPCILFAEVPCIDRVFESGRLADFFYEHVSHFTTDSFNTLMRRCGEVKYLSYGYNKEVIYALVQLEIPEKLKERSVQSSDFAKQAQKNKNNIQTQLDNLAADGARIAIWGGTGKAAAFMNQFNVDAERFPLVVDSDPEKVGTFVPGSGQEILSKDVLKITAVNIVIIPTQWRAKDIIAEMARENIRPDSILIEHNGSLIDFNLCEHPYH